MNTNEKRKLNPTYGRTGRGQGCWKGQPDTRHHEGKGFAKITDEQALEIRRLYATGDWLQREIGELYGLKQAAVSHIVLGRYWRHLPI